MPAYKDNRQLIDFVMSVTGTLISTVDEGKPRLRVIEPRADQKEFIGAYLKGGDTSAITCNDQQKCLLPRLTQVSIPDTESLKSKVIRKIGELRGKYVSKERIGNEDIHFLNDAVNLPVYRYIQVSVAAGTVFMMEDAAEYIGANVLLAQFDRVMSEVLEAVDALQKIQLEDSAIAEFKKNLQEARGRVQAMLIGANNGSIHLLNQSIQAIEQSIIARNS
jgi:conjugative transfer pilus assembly protein TraH